MLSLVTLIIVPYLAFVFFGEGVNPVTKPHQPMMRSRWRYGRRMALAAAIGWLTTMVLMHYAMYRLELSLASGLVVAAVLGLCFSAGRIGSVFRQKSLRLKS